MEGSRTTSPCADRSRAPRSQQRGGVTPGRGHRHRIQDRGFGQFALQLGPPLSRRWPGLGGLPAASPLLPSPVSSCSLQAYGQADHSFPGWEASSGKPCGCTRLTPALGELRSGHSCRPLSPASIGSSFTSLHLACSLHLAHPLCLARPPTHCLGPPAARLACSFPFSPKPLHALLLQAALQAPTAVMPWGTDQGARPFLPIPLTYSGPERPPFPGGHTWVRGGTLRKWPRPGVGCEGTQARPAPRLSPAAPMWCPQVYPEPPAAGWEEV